MFGWDMSVWERQVRHLPAGCLCVAMESGYDFVSDWAIDEMRNRYTPEEIIWCIECKR